MWIVRDAADGSELFRSTAHCVAAEAKDHLAEAGFDVRLEQTKGGKDDADHHSQGREH